MTTNDMKNGHLNAMSIRLYEIENKYLSVDELNAFGSLQSIQTNTSDSIQL